MVYIGCHGTNKKGYAVITNDEKVYGKELKSYLSKLPCKIILIVDTCHAGAMAEEWSDCSSNVSIICSCSSDEYAYCWQLSQAIIEALDGHADYDGNGLIDLDEIRQYVIHRVPELSGKQHPVLSTCSPKIVLAKN